MSYYDISVRLDSLENNEHYMDPQFLVEIQDSPIYNRIVYIATYERKCECRQHDDYDNNRLDDCIEYYGDPELDMLKKLKRLPKNLQYLDLDKDSEGIPLVYHFKELPETLKKIVTQLNDRYTIKLSDNLEDLYCSEGTKLPDLPDNLKLLNIRNMHIKEIKSLPKSLITLNIYQYSNSNLILENLPKTLENLYIYGYSISNYLDLSQLNRLKKLELINCRLNKLGDLPDSLEKFKCEGSKLKSLPKLPSGLKELYCSYNEIEKLPELPHGLQIIECNQNEIKNIPKLPWTLEKFNFRINKFSQLLSLDTIKFLTFNLYRYKDIKNQYYYRPENIDWLYESTYNNYLKPDNGFYHICKELQISENIKLSIYEYVQAKLAIQKIENWFLECKYNPKYAYCRRKINKDYLELYSEDKK